MGRWYNGTISGKWAFGILESSTPSHYHPVGPKETFCCPMGSEDNDDWIEFEGDDDPRIMNVPEADWTEAQKYFMDTHAECFKYEKPMCGSHREDHLFYNFEKDDIGFVEAKMRFFASRLPGRSLDFARMDFNALAEAFPDELGDDNETYVPFEVPLPKMLEWWPSDGNKIAYYIFPYAFKRWTEEGGADVIEPDFDRTINGNPLEPVCCSCQKMVAAKFHKKKRICTQWEFDRESAHYNPFLFQGEEWCPGKKFTTTGPFFCDSCRQHWFWDELLPKDDRRYYYFPEIWHNFQHDCMVWSFGEQLRQALTYGDVWIESEC